MSDDKTDSKTLWTETMLEVLYDTLKRGKPDSVINEVLGDLKNKGYRTEYLVSKVEMKVSAEAAARVRKLMS